MAGAGAVGLKVILDHHTNEGGEGGQQANGLWYDLGPGSNGNDGAGHTGTVTQQVMGEKKDKGGKRGHNTENLFMLFLKDFPKQLGCPCTTLRRKPNCHWIRYRQRAPQLW